MSEGAAGAVRRLTVKNPRVEFLTPGVHEEQVFFDVCTKCEKAQEKADSKEGR